MIGVIDLTYLPDKRLCCFQERVVTVIGEPDCNRKAMAMILEKILEDPQSGSCLNISYSDVHGLVANFNPTGSPFAQVVRLN